MTGRRIVLVEDDESVRMIAQISLTELGGHQVLALASGAEAVAQAAAFSPDLLVLDVSMPGMDGPQTLAALRTQSAMRHVPAVFLTAHTDARQVARFRSMGAADVIAKPFDPQHLCDRVADALAWPETMPAPLLEALPPAARRPTALVIEDDPVNRYLLDYILKQNGWDVSEAHDGPQALAAIARGPISDVVLMDVMLPGIDGLKLLDMLRAERRWDATPVMMLTSRDDEPTIGRALAAGADDYLAKPFDLAELLARLDRLPRPRKR